MENAYQTLSDCAPSNLVRIGYISHFEPNLGTSGLMTLYYEAHKDCSEHEITGLLISDGKKIGNILEGHAPSIHDHLYRVQSDSRFKKICLFEMHPVSSRLYDRWSMHIKDGFIMNLMFPECASTTHEIDSDSTEEVLAIMYSYALLVRPSILS